MAQQRWLYLMVTKKEVEQQHSAQAGRHVKTNVKDQKAHTRISSREFSLVLTLYKEACCLA